MVDTLFLRLQGYLWNQIEPANVYMGNFADLTDYKKGYYEGRKAAYDANFIEGYANSYLALGYNDGWVSQMYTSCKHDTLRIYVCVTYDNRLVQVWLTHNELTDQELATHYAGDHLSIPVAELYVVDLTQDKSYRQGQNEAIATNKQHYDLQIWDRDDIVAKTMYYLGYNSVFDEQLPN